MSALAASHRIRRTLADAIRRAADRIGPPVPDESADIRLVADNSFDVIIRLDRNWNRTYVSPAIMDVLGVTPAAFRAMDWRDGVHPDDLHVLTGTVDLFQTGIPAATTTAYRRFRPDGTLVWLESTFRRLPEGEGFVSVLRDVTERNQADEKLRHLAYHEALTGLANRTAFGLGMDQRLREQARSGEPFALMALDLDRFKEVNDTLGHQVGDLLLKAVAKRLRSLVREVDLLARIGGDEFAVLLHGPTSPSDAASFATRIVEAICQPYVLEDDTVLVGVSAGVAMAPQDGTTATLLVKNADLALYRAKAAGRNTFRFFEPSMDQRMRTRRSLELELQRAVERGEFEVFYQPLFDVRSQRIRGFEALVRWNHPVRGIVPPTEFIPLAEETQLIVEIGAFVLQTATAQAASWGDSTTVAVNLSAVQITQGGLVETVAAALRQSGLPAHRLDLEITESVLLHDGPEVLEVLHALRDQGVRIAMDDFGTGYSSLRYLRSFPFDKIKIDRSFVRDVLTNEESAAIIAAVVGLGRRLGIALTAEGVETTAQLARMEQEGCDTVQGYLIGRPMPAREAGRLLCPAAATPSELDCVS